MRRSRGWGSIFRRLGVGAEKGQGWGIMFEKGLKVGGVFLKRTPSWGCLFEKHSILGQYFIFLGPRVCLIGMGIVFVCHALKIRCVLIGVLRGCGTT